VHQNARVERPAGIDHLDGLDGRDNWHDGRTNGHNGWHDAAPNGNGRSDNRGSGSGRNHDRPGTDHRRGSDVDDGSDRLWFG
jgi:hypothetical protein